MFHGLIDKLDILIAQFNRIIELLERLAEKHEHQ
jgi:hypothetical protein